MRSIFHLLLLCCFAFSGVYAANPLTQQEALTRTEAKAPKDKKKFWLFLLIGQSNMVGKNRPEEEDMQDTPRVLVLNKSGDGWDQARDPLHLSGKWNNVQWNGVGPGLPFAKELLNHIPKDVTIGLIPAARGGVSINKYRSFEDLYKRAIKWSHRAMEDGELKGILWHQGESDGRTQKGIDNYAEKFKELVANLRKDLKSPDVLFIAGKLGCFDYTDEWKGSLEITKVLEETVPKMKNVGLVDSNGLKEKGDKLHFSRDSQIEFGKRFAEVWLKLYKDK